MERIVVGLTGPGCGGKGELAGYLKELGFTYISLSDILRKKSGSEDRKVLQDLGDALRAEDGHGVLAKLAGEKIKESPSNLFVIDSIRHPEEIRYLWKFFDTNIIGATASYETLFARMKARDREGDPETFEEFLQMQKRELGESGSNVMNIAECLHIANRVIINEGTKEELRKNAEIALKELGVSLWRIKREREC